MYGFGDDRNPANDTVNVMEEILVEYIVDVVRRNLSSIPCLLTKETLLPVPNSSGAGEEVTAIHRRSTSCVVEASRREEACPYGRAAFHAGGYQESPCAVRGVRHEPGQLPVMIFYYTLPLFCRLAVLYTVLNAVTLLVVVLMCERGSPIDTRVWTLVACSDSACVAWVVV